MRFRSLLMLFLWLCRPLHLLAHEVHVSTAEAEYHFATKRLEISLTVFINDLELALIRQSERLLLFEKTPAAELDAQIFHYLTQNFVIRDAAGKVAQLIWVGREVDPEKAADPAVTLHFEAILPEPLETHRLEHRLLTDLFKDQVNLLHLRKGAEKVELKFDLQKSHQRLTFTEPP